MELEKINIQSKISKLVQAGCLAMAYAYRYGGANNIKSVIDCLLDGWLDGDIEDNGYVAKPVKYLNLINPKGSRVRDISKVFINSLDELPEGNWVVEYVSGAQTHFVVANKRGIVFDPSYPSLTCAKGKVFSYRKLLY